MTGAFNLLCLKGDGKTAQLDFLKHVMGHLMELVFWCKLNISNIDSETKEVLKTVLYITYRIVLCGLNNLQVLHTHTRAHTMNLGP